MHSAASTRCTVIVSNGTHRHDFETAFGNQALRDAHGVRSLSLLSSVSLIQPYGRGAGMEF